jgi:NAD(P)H-flavin reductase
VRDILRATPRAFLVRLGLERRRFHFKAGQAIMLGLPDGPDRVPYSIACSPESAHEWDCLELLIRTTDSGDLAEPLAGLRAATLVSVEGPIGTFVLPDPLDARHLLFVAGGTGIAPLRAMIQSVLRSASAPDLSLLYSARSEAELAFKDEFRRLANAGRLHLCLTITREEDPRWTGERGRITQPLLARMVQSGASLCFLCGPDSFVADMKRMLIALGVRASRIRHEEF